MTVLAIGHKRIRAEVKVQCIRCHRSISKATAIYIPALDGYFGSECARKVARINEVLTANGLDMFIENRYHTIQYQPGEVAQLNTKWKELQAKAERLGLTLSFRKDSETQRTVIMGVSSRSPLRRGVFE